VRIGSAIKGTVLVVVWPVTGLAGGAVPSRAPGKYGGSTQGPNLWSRGGAGNSVWSHGGWTACGVGARRGAAGRGTFFRVGFQWGAVVDERAGPLGGGTAQSLHGKSHESPALADGGAGVGRQEVNEA
jgi:hypothetical protein